MIQEHCAGCEIYFTNMKYKSLGANFHTINSIDVGCRWTIDKHQINSTNAGCTEQLNITLETFQRCNRGVITKGSSIGCHKADPINVHNYPPTITTCLHRQMRSNSLCLSQIYPVCSWHTASSIP
jgi:hypothetical protein